MQPIFRLHLPMHACVCVCLYCVPSSPLHRSFFPSRPYGRMLSAVLCGVWCVYIWFSVWCKLRAPSIETPVSDKKQSFFGNDKWNQLQFGQRGRQQQKHSKNLFSPSRLKPVNVFAIFLKFCVGHDRFFHCLDIVFRWQTINWITQSYRRDKCLLCVYYNI